VFYDFECFVTAPIFYSSRFTSFFTENSLDQSNLSEFFRLQYILCKAPDIKVVIFLNFNCVYRVPLLLKISGCSVSAVENNQSLYCLNNIAQARPCGFERSPILQG
jgi:hypothetical protein